MKRKLLLISTLAIGVFSFAQVGIETDTPQATLDVVGKPSVTTKVDGLIAPRLTRAELTSKGNNLYGTAQNGALIYITNVTGGDQAGQRVNIRSIGYYVFDATINQWIKLVLTEPWNVASSASYATTNTENIYQNANVGIGDFTTTSPATNLHVKGEAFASSRVGVGSDLYFSSSYNTSPDAIIKRLSANNIQVESALTVKNNGGSTYNLRLFDSTDTTTDSQPTFSVNKNGAILLGSRTSSPDVRISRGGPNWLRFQNVTLSISKDGTAGLTPGLRLSTNDLSSSTNPYPLFEIMVNGKLRWGDGITTEPDLSLERDPATKKLRLEGPGYDGATGVRYLVYNTANKLIEMSTTGPSTRVGDPNAIGVDYQPIINDLTQRLRAQEDRINQLENLIRSLSPQNPN